MTVVVDSNIWISGLEFAGMPSQVLVKVTLEDELAVCAELEEEVLRIMEQRFGHSRDFTRSRLEPFWNAAVRVAVTGEVQGVCRDPKDDFVLECAVKSGAELIVTGDKDLLSMGEFRSVRIVTGAAGPAHCRGAGAMIFSKLWPGANAPPSLRTGA